MFTNISKYFASLGALLSWPFRMVWRAIKHYYPERDIIYIADGDAVSRHQTSFWRFARSFGKIVLCVWAAWSTYVFVYHRPMLERRTRQLNEAREQHAMQMSNLAEYASRYSELHKEMNSIYDQMTNTKKKLSDADRDALARRQVNTWAQIEILRTRMENMMTDDDYTPDWKQFSELTLEYDLTREENASLRAKNLELERAMTTVSNADEIIVDRIEQLTNEKINDITGNLKKIKSTMTSLGLGDAAVLSARARRESNYVVGAALMPLMLPAGVDEKYTALGEKIELWQGLARAHEMLPLGAPVGGRANITSSFGSRTDPIDGTPDKHRGIDFAGSAGTPLLAVAQGRVTFAGEKSGYGKTVEIEHGMGFSTLYAHLSKINVERGDMVKSRDVVGLAGNTGRSTGPHLHYEIRFKDAPFNPYSFVKGE
ncbi:MAG: peptidoglycan DD-metalloendopeptidase family protein [Rickettsiales bacterium]|jgi:murein DD-endopeptidase MepM/ murein hydrolase activator NlpD|nr:peptidoglycan DD-metalloendopeptidase family protein [Rickettsiales bacterium]